MATFHTAISGNGILFGRVDKPIIRHEFPINAMRQETGRRSKKVWKPLRVQPYRWSSQWHTLVLHCHLIWVLPKWAVERYKPWWGPCSLIFPLHHWHLHYPLYHSFTRPHRIASSSPQENDLIHRGDHCFVCSVCCLCPWKSVHSQPKEPNPWMVEPNPRSLVQYELNPLLSVYADLYWTSLGACRWWPTWQFARSRSIVASNPLDQSFILKPWSSTFSQSFRTIVFFFAAEIQSF